MTERKFYAVADTIYHEGRPVLGAFFGRNGKLTQLLDKLAALMSAADFEVEPEKHPDRVWDEFCWGYEEKRDKVKNALANGAPVFMAEEKKTSIRVPEPVGGWADFVDNMRKAVVEASCIMDEEKPAPKTKEQVAEENKKENEQEPDDLWLKPGTPAYAKWMEDEFKAGGRL